jgi:hypothetical protein
MRCKTCKKKLIELEDRYLHPRTTDQPCNEKDGYSLTIEDKFLADKFNERYPIKKSLIKRCIERWGKQR